MLHVSRCSYPQHMNVNSTVSYLRNKREGKLVLTPTAHFPLPHPSLILQSTVYTNSFYPPTPHSLSGHHSRMAGTLTLKSFCQHDQSMPCCQFLNSLHLSSSARYTVDSSPLLSRNTFLLLATMTPFFLIDHSYSVSFDEFSSTSKFWASLGFGLEASSLPTECQYALWLRIPFCGHWFPDTISNYHLVSPFRC